MCVCAGVFVVEKNTVETITHKKKIFFSHFLGLLFLPKKKKNIGPYHSLSTEKNGK